VVLRSVRGERTVRAADFFEGHFTTAIADDELLVEVRVPVARPGEGWSFAEVSRRAGDFALVGVAAMLRVDARGAIADCRISLLGVGPKPVRADNAEASLVGTMPSPDAFAAAAQAATADLLPPSDVHGSAAFRRHLASVTVRRALERAFERTGGGM